MSQLQSYVTDSDQNINKTITDCDTKIYVFYVFYEYSKSILSRKRKGLKDMPPYCTEIRK